MIGRTFPIALLLSAAGCGADNEAERAAAEHECRQRLAEASAPGLPAGARNPVAGAFRSASDKLSAMDRAGCSAAQRDAADRMKAGADRVVAAAGRIRFQGLAPAQPHDPRQGEAFMALQAELEGYERRRAALLR